MKLLLCLIVLIYREEMGLMDRNKVFSSLCYFSVFFAALLFPIVVYFIVDDNEVKNHAKKSIISHIIPFIASIILAGVFIGGAFLNTAEVVFPWILVSGMVIVTVISLAVTIYNIVQGIKVLID